MNLYQASEPLIIQLPHSSVIFKRELSQASGKVMPKLYVQSSCAYGYQRELTVEFRHRPGNSKDLYYEYHVYHHPGRREIGEISKKVFDGFMLRFLRQVQHYPDLLFNAGTPDRARCSGFVHLCEALHRGTRLSSTLL